MLKEFMDCAPCRNWSKKACITTLTLSLVRVYSTHAMTYNVKFPQAVLVFIPIIEQDLQEYVEFWNSSIPLGIA